MPPMRRARSLSLALALVLGTSGCCGVSNGTRSMCTKFGYFPEHVATWGDDAGGAPLYDQVRRWAVEVADGYDTRHTTNRYALYVGAITAAASVGAMAGLAAFAPGSSAILGIPIGTSFLGGMMAIYQNDPKARIYDFGSRAIKDLVSLSDCRILYREQGLSLEQNNAIQAICLHRDVDLVMRSVARHIEALDPKSANEMLKNVATSVEAQRAGAALAKDHQQALQAELDQAKDVAAHGTDTATKAAAQNRVDALTPLVSKATDEANRRQQAADTAVDTVLALALENVDDLLVVHSTCPIPPGCLRKDEIVYSAPTTITTTTTSTSNTSTTTASTTTTSTKPS